MRLIVLHPCIRFPDPAFSVLHVVKEKPAIYFRDHYLPSILEGAYAVLDFAAVPPSRMAGDSTVAAVVWDMDADRVRFFGWNPEATAWVEFEAVGFEHHEEPAPVVEVVESSPEVVEEPTEPAPVLEAVESSPEVVEEPTEPAPVLEAAESSPEAVEEPTEPAPVVEAVESSPEVVEDPNAPE